MLLLQGQVGQVSDLTGGTKLAHQSVQTMCQRGFLDTGTSLAGRC